MTTKSNTYSMNTGFQVQGSNGQPVELPCTGKILRPIEILYPLAHTASRTGADICLQKKSLLRLTGDHDGEKLFVETGIAWINQSGRSEDIFLHAGESLDIIHKGAILVEGVVDTQLKLITASGPHDIGGTLGNSIHHILSVLSGPFPKGR